MVAASELDMWRVASNCISKLLRTAFSSSDEYARRLIALNHLPAGLTVQLVVGSLWREAAKHAGV